MTPCSHDGRRSSVAGSRKTMAGSLCIRQRYLGRRRVACTARGILRLIAEGTRGIGAILGGRRRSGIPLTRRTKKSVGRLSVWSGLCLTPRTRT